MVIMQKIIQDFSHFIQLSSENLWTLEGEINDNFKLYVDTPENQLDSFLSQEYLGTPLWFYFLSFDYSLFDYFKERIPLKTDWDYTLLFNIDYIQSSSYFNSLSEDFYFSHLTPFCPFSVFFHIFNQQYTSGKTFKFTFPILSFQKLSQPSHSLNFFDFAKIGLNISSLSHIIQHDYDTGIYSIHSIVNNPALKESFVYDLSISRQEDFFDLKINLFFQYPQLCSSDFKQQLNPQKLHQLVTQIIIEKQSVDKELLFVLMDKEHLILSLITHYFTHEELYSFVQDKEISYHLLHHKLHSVSKKILKNNKI